MAKKKKQKAAKVNETDALYFLKLVGYLILGSLWIKVSKGETVQIPIPIGFGIGLILATHDHIQLDRKVGYAVLLVAMLVGFWTPIGIYLFL